MEYVNMLSLRPIPPQESTQKEYVQHANKILYLG